MKMSFDSAFSKQDIAKFKQKDQDFLLASLQQNQKGKSHIVGFNNRVKNMPSLFEISSPQRKSEREKDRVQNTLNTSF